MDRLLTGLAVIDFLLYFLIGWKKNYFFLYDLFFFW